MKKFLFLLPIILVSLTSCGTINRMNDLVSGSTNSIYENAQAVQQSTAVIQQNQQIINESTRTLQENRSLIEKAAAS